jgi:endonuclease YncB( thermonuclease family)
MLAAWLLVAAAQAAAFELHGRIVGVVDGDTVDLLTDSKQLVRARLAGIDAPERAQPFGAVAKKALSDLVFSKRATLTGSKRDRYGRVVAKVSVDGRDVNLAMVRMGYAWHYKKYQAEQKLSDRAIYSEAQDAAARTRSGLWSHQQPVAPWDFRSIRRNKNNGQDPAV